MQEIAANLADEFKNNLKVLAAIGDETRQGILLALIQGPQTPGMRVGEIKERTHLSRPAVSHHLRILREAQIISVRKEGTIHYYTLNAKSHLKRLKNLVNQIDLLLAQCD